MADALALLLSLACLATALAAAVARPRWLPEAVAAAAGAALLVAPGRDRRRRRAATRSRDLAPTVAFLAALLILAEGCRREGLFDAIGALLVRHARRQPRRLLALVFGVAAGVTAVLSLDATVVLLTPDRLRERGAHAHLAEAARLRVLAPRQLRSLLLPVSNLTNLLAFHASGLSFTRFAALMALPTAARSPSSGSCCRASSPASSTARARRAPADEAGGGCRARRSPCSRSRWRASRLSSPLGIAPVWVAAAGAAAITVPALVRGRTRRRRSCAPPSPASSSSSSASA